MSVTPWPGSVHERSTLERIPESCAMLIFGATGDLTRRKLVPALYRLMQEHLLPPGISVIGNSRIKMSEEEFRSLMKAAVEEFGDGIDPDVWRQFSQGLFYVPGSADDSQTYHSLATR